MTDDETTVVVDMDNSRFGILAMILRAKMMTAEV